jgi:hypothetical protein
VWSPYLYDKKYSPRYSVAFGVNTGMCAIAIVTCLLLRFCLARENRKLDMLESDREEEANRPSNSFRFVL